MTDHLWVLYVLCMVNNYYCIFFHELKYNFGWLKSSLMIISGYKLLVEWIYAYGFWKTYGAL